MARTQVPGCSAETSPSARFLREYIDFGGIAMARRDTNPGSPYYRFTDHLGSLRVLTDSTGTIKQELDYDPFGAEIAVTPPQATDDWYRFISRERDAESTNDHYWFRQYSPRLARWCSADPLGGSVDAPQSLNRYAYVLNNPANFYDPYGLQCTVSEDGGTITCEVSAPAPPPDPTTFWPWGPQPRPPLIGEPEAPDAPEQKKNPKPEPPKPNPACQKEVQECLDRAEKKFWKDSGPVLMASSTLDLPSIGCLGLGPFAWKCFLIMESISFGAKAIAVSPPVIEYLKERDRCNQLCQ